MSKFIFVRTQAILNRSYSVSPGIFLWLPQLDVTICDIKFVHFVIRQQVVDESWIQRYRDPRPTRPEKERWSCLTAGEGSAGELPHGRRKSEESARAIEEVFFKMIASLFTYES